MSLIDSIIGAESGGNPNASNPNSSASGLGQFVSGTWLDTIKSARPDLAQGKSDDELLALRADPQLSRQMTEAYAQQNQSALAKAGVPVTPGTTYLAHFSGPQGAIKVLQADPSALVSDILGPTVVKANPFLSGMTAQGLQAWAAKKMGASLPQPGAQPQDAPGPANVIPQAAPPILPQAIQTAQQQQGQEAAPSFAQIPDVQAPPIFFAPRRSPDLSHLRAAFKAPVFPRG